ncbi:unnamed protein product [Cylicocyclus nassatus]|uniref:Uncharacterized protein n=1 Tax=Cylicocyclus nassatus TaxID=53992 RepID=A0AA36M5D3_CYLNA|nr:unnamed protein product [Cylicocyclus nassatus]
MHARQPHHFGSSRESDSQVMNRGVLSLLRTNPLLRRALHKGVDSSPPLRWVSVPEKIALYMFISVTFLSYPTYVLLSLDNLRPRVDNELNPEVQAQIDEIRAARQSHQ